jgi:hypothetical protein
VPVLEFSTSTTRGHHVTFRIRSASAPPLSRVRSAPTLQRGEDPPLRVCVTGASVVYSLVIHNLPTLL